MTDRDSTIHALAAELVAEKKRSALLLGALTNLLTVWDRKHTEQGSEWIDAFMQAKTDARVALAEARGDK